MDRWNREGEDLKLTPINNYKGDVNSADNGMSYERYHTEFSEKECFKIVYNFCGHQGALRYGEQYEEEDYINLLNKLDKLGYIEEKSSDWFEISESGMDMIYPFISNISKTLIKRMLEYHDEIIADELYSWFGEKYNINNKEDQQCLIDYFTSNLHRYGYKVKK